MDATRLESLYDAVAELGGRVSDQGAKIGDLDGDLHMVEMRLNNMEELASEVIQMRTLLEQLIEKL